MQVSTIVSPIKTNSTKFTYCSSKPTNQANKQTGKTNGKKVDGSNVYGDNTNNKQKIADLQKPQANSVGTIVDPRTNEPVEQQSKIDYKV